MFDSDGSPRAPRQPHMPEVPCGNPSATSGMDLAGKSVALASMVLRWTKSFFIATHLQLHLGDGYPALRLCQPLPKPQHRPRERIRPVLGEEQPGILYLAPLPRARNGVAQPIGPFLVEEEVLQAPPDQGRHIEPLQCV